MGCGNQPGGGLDEIAPEDPDTQRLLDPVVVVPGIDGLRGEDADGLFGHIEGLLDKGLLGWGADAERNFCDAPPESPVTHLEVHAGGVGDRREHARRVEVDLVPLDHVDDVTDVEAGMKSAKGATLQVDRDDHLAADGGDIAAQLTAAIEAGEDGRRRPKGALQKARHGGEARDGEQARVTVQSVGVRGRVLPIDIGENYTETGAAAAPLKYQPHI
jgi:hypothetical protein